MYLFFDTETTGFPSLEKAPRDPTQGRICQIAMILADEKGHGLAEFSSLVLPDAWTISEGAGKVHGLTDALCAEYGIESRKAFLMFLQFARKAKTFVAHNLDFDYKMLMIESVAHGVLLPQDREMFCTMKASTDICRLPKKRGSGYKWPKLEEALPIICGRELGDGAHDAMVDTRGCKDLFFALKEREIAEGLV